MGSKRGISGLQGPSASECPALAAFIDGMRKALSQDGFSEEKILLRVSALMRRLVSTDTWLAPSYSETGADSYRQFLLYRDPFDRFSVVSFVWGPGQSTPIHDHGVWGVIGMLRGAEFAQRFVLGADGRPERSGPPERLNPGETTTVSPATGDVHKVCNAYSDRVSVSIHVYDGNIGAIRRSMFVEASGLWKEFVSGYSNLPG